MIYVIGSLRNTAVPEVAEALRNLGYKVFDDWYSAGPEADDKWRDHQMYKGLSYKEALKGAAAVNVYEFDKRNLDASDVAVLVMPAGKSGHLELGYMAGKGKQTFVLFPDGEPERWDVMYQFATGICFSFDELTEALKKVKAERTASLDINGARIPQRVFMALVGKAPGSFIWHFGIRYSVNNMGLIEADKVPLVIHPKPECF